jgi:hypothetical protein
LKAQTDGPQNEVFVVVSVAVGATIGKRLGGRAR